MVTRPNNDPEIPLKVTGFDGRSMNASVKADGLVDVSFTLSRPTTNFEDSFIADNPLSLNQQQLEFDSYESTVRLSNVPASDLPDIVVSLNGALGEVERQAAVHAENWAKNISQAVEILDGIDFEA